MTDDRTAQIALGGGLLGTVTLAQINTALAIVCGLCGAIIGIPNAARAVREKWIPWLKKLRR